MNAVENGFSVISSVQPPRCSPSNPY